MRARPELTLSVGIPRSGDGWRQVTLLALGQGTSTVGDGCYAVALPWYLLASR